MNIVFMTVFLLVVWYPIQTFFLKAIGQFLSPVSFQCCVMYLQHRIYSSWYTFCLRALQYSGWFSPYLYTGTFTWNLYTPMDFDKCFKYHTKKFLHLKMFWLEPFKVLLSPKTLTETELFHSPNNFTFSRMSYKMNNAIYILLHLASFNAQQNALEIHLCCYRIPHFILLYC